MLLEKNIRALNGVIMRKIFFLTAVGLFFQGCASTFQLDPVTLDGQQQVLQEGEKAVVSPRKALVAVRPGAKTYSSAGYTTLVVTVVNGSEEAFLFSTENVQVFVDGKPHKVFTYDETEAGIMEQKDVAERNQTEQFRTALMATALRKTNVLPHAWYGGYVTLGKLPGAGRPHDIRVVVTAAGEEHEFLFRQLKASE
ncbi:hypothetical protein Ptc2401_00925 [Prosthecochloris sp. CIB 2401]|nr:hypothetical protein Ptc2401_00925 [Prosthecochloris sp. CIB 2401]